jgi:hypothetical protein
MTENETAKQILDAAFLVHTKLGPGLLESVYEVILAYEQQVLTQLRLSGLKLGLLINFGEAHLKNGIKRIINGRLDEESFSEFSL